MEEKITITIDEDGTMQVKTDGFLGEACFDAVDEILDEDAIFESIKTTDDFYKPNSSKINNIQQLRGK